MKTTIEVSIVVITKLNRLAHAEILAFTPVLAIVLNSLLESSCSTVTLTVFTVANVNGVKDGQMTRGGVLNGKDKNLRKLTLTVFDDNSIVAYIICGTIQNPSHKSMLWRGILVGSINKQASARHFINKKRDVKMRQNSR